MSLPSPRILLVDDDEGLLECLRVALEARGLAVQVARDGNEALCRIETETPDVVVLDLVMPRRSGYAVLSRIRRRPDGTPRVLVASGNDEPRHRENAVQRGADAFLAKPYAVADCILLIERLAARSSRPVENVPATFE